MILGYLLLMMAGTGVILTHENEPKANIFRFTPHIIASAIGLFLILFK